MSRKSHASSLQAVYNYVSAGYPVTLKDICLATGLSQTTVRKCRDELMANGFIKVDHFVGNSVAYKSNASANYVSVFGDVSSIEDNAFSFLVRVEGFTFDINGDTIRQVWDLNLDRSIMKSIAEFVATYDETSDVPFF